MQEPGRDDASRKGFNPDAPSFNPSKFMSRGPSDSTSVSTPQNSDAHRTEPARQAEFTSQPRGDNGAVFHHQPIRYDGHKPHTHYGDPRAMRQRRPCRYGAECNRTSQSQHITEFSHPNDLDWHDNQHGSRHNDHRAPAQHHHSSAQAQHAPGGPSGGAPWWHNYNHKLHHKRHGESHDRPVPEPHSAEPHQPRQNERPSPPHQSYHESQRTPHLSTMPQPPLQPMMRPVQVPVDIYGRPLPFEKLDPQTQQQILAQNYEYEMYLQQMQRRLHQQQQQQQQVHPGLGPHQNLHHYSQQSGLSGRAERYNNHSDHSRSWRDRENHYHGNHHPHRYDGSRPHEHREVNHIPPGVEFNYEEEQPHQTVKNSTSDAPNAPKASTKHDEAQTGEEYDEEEYYDEEECYDEEYDEEEYYDEEAGEEDEEEAEDDDEDDEAQAVVESYTDELDDDEISTFDSPNRFNRNLPHYQQKRLKYVPKQQPKAATQPTPSIETITQEMASTKISSDSPAK